MILTAHAEIRAGVDHHRALEELGAIARDEFRIDHPTFQLEQTVRPRSRSPEL